MDILSKTKIAHSVLVDVLHAPIFPIALVALRQEKMFQIVLVMMDTSMMGLMPHVLSVKIGARNV